MKIGGRGQRLLRPFLYADGERTSESAPLTGAVLPWTLLQGRRRHACGMKIDVVVFGVLYIHTCSDFQTTRTRIGVIYNVIAVVSPAIFAIYH